MKSLTLNIDCIEGMKKYPDKYFDLALVAPPSGKGEYPPPGKEYFDELIRVSVNQIIWGASHYTNLLPFNSNGWLVWDKQNLNNSYSDCVLAWTSFNIPVKMFTHSWNCENRIHPYQEPVVLYEWVLALFAKVGDKILDTHMGSGTSRIACKDKFDYVGFELNKEYFDLQEKRYENFRV
jgi:site-specific DNA-methyltransferase (adenine-specific)